MDTVQYESPNSLRRLINSNNRSKHEDILVTKYLDKLQNHEGDVHVLRPERRKLDVDSPYLQKLSHSNFLQSIVNGNNHQPARPSSTNRTYSRNPFNRPNSSTENTSRNHPHSHSKTHDSSLKHTTSDSLNHLNKRSGSAPMRRAESELSLRNGPKKGSKTLFQRLPQLIRAVAFRNGNRDTSVYITAKSLIEFLEIATDRLELDRAARRVFLENGDEIKNEAQMLRNAVVYVSCGEEFRDPFLTTKRQIDQSKSIQWRSEGVRLTTTGGEKSSTRKTKKSDDDEFSTNEMDTPKTNKPLKSASNNSNKLLQSARCSRRLVAYENGNEFDPVIVFWEYLSPACKSKMHSDEVKKLEAKYFNEFLYDCKQRMKIGGKARNVYDWQGQQVQSLEDVDKLDRCLQPLVSFVEHVPIWVSKGEEFIARGALLFVQNLLKYTRLNRADLVMERKKVQVHLEKLEKERPNISVKLASTREKEYNEKIAEIQATIDEFDRSISKLNEILSHLHQLSEKQANEGYGSLFKHIKQVDTNDKIFGGVMSKGLKLKIFLNGTNESFEMFYNLKDWSAAKVDEKDVQKAQMKYLLDEITSTYQKIKGKSASGSMKFTRIFNDKGDEIKEMSKLVNGKFEFVWVSCGENWREHKEATLAVTLGLNLLFAMKASQFGASSSMPQDEPENHESEQDKEEAAAAAIIDSDAEFEFEISKYTKQAQPKRKQSFVKPASNSSEFKTYIRPIKPRPKDECGHKRTTLIAENIDPSEEKPQLWEVLGEREALTKLTEFAVEFQDELLRGDVVEVEEAKVKRLLVQSKRERDLFLLPQLLVKEKVAKVAPPPGPENAEKAGKKNQVALFHDFQEWKFNKAGFIYSSFFPRICLTLNTRVQIRLEVHFRARASQETKLLVKNGYVVVLGTRELNDENTYRDKDQQWSFTKYGKISSKALGDSKMFLTSTDLLLTELAEMSKNEGGTIERYELNQSDESGKLIELNSKDVGIFLLESFEPNESPASLQRSQRWAIKQENSKSIGQWRNSKLATPTWHKLALSWPVDENEELINDFKWPMSGLLIPGAPPLRDVDKPTESASIRFRVIKNGTSAASEETKEPTYVCKLDSKHLMKEFVHCSDISYRQFEFNMFLDSCTQALGLSSAARRIFNQQGVELFELANLKQDEVLYVSTGEAWLNPKQVKVDLEKKSIMTGLSDDLVKIAYFNRLKETETNDRLVIETYNSGVQEGVRLLLGKPCLNREQIDRIKRGESLQFVVNPENNVQNFEDETETKPRTAHEKSHIHAGVKTSKKWPWEIGFENGEDAYSDLEREFLGPKLADSLSASPRRSNDLELLSNRIKPRATPAQQRSAKLSSQRFVFNKTNGFISLADKTALVLTVREVSDPAATVSEVFLARKNEDSLNQRWIYRAEDGCIVSRIGSRSNLCLSVRLPAIESTGFDLNQVFTQSEMSFYEQAPLVVQPLVDFDNGLAHQKWHIDETVGFIYAFATNNDDIGVTAANKAGICSYYVTFEKEISQPVRRT